ncbi:hypothetical protein V5279_24515 [Bradyrhizobium sp. 26S5]|uniref:hypothetical protein n=1 Tax=Bradyrhizobium sp. 26S5 TaxID=3139729 RepID=UPI0030D2D20F
MSETGSPPIARSAPRTPAERMRTYRANKKAARAREEAGRCIITAQVDGVVRKFEINKGDLADGFVERRILKQWDSEDSRAIAFALEQELKRAIDGCS